MLEHFPGTRDFSPPSLLVFQTHVFRVAVLAPTRSNLTNFDKSGSCSEQLIWTTRFAFGVKIYKPLMRQNVISKIFFKNLYCVHFRAKQALSDVLTDTSGCIPHLVFEFPTVAPCRRQKASVSPQLTARTGEKTREIGARESQSASK